MKLGFVIVTAELKQTGKAQSYPEIRAMAQAAEEAGLDSLWVYDHFLYRQDNKTIGIWEGWTILAALAEATSRVELGSLVMCNSFRNPALLAKMAITLDEISGGRLILGLGAGWNQPEYEAFGYPFDHRVDRFEEALEIICPLLKEGRVDFQGKYYQAKDCEITPRGPRPSGPPILIGGFGPRMLNLTARFADMWNIGYFGSPETFVEPLGKIQLACREAGRDPNSLETTALAYLVFPDMMPEMPEFENGALMGTASELAEAFRGYERLGVSHLMIHSVPYHRAALDRLAEAIRLYKQN